MNRSHSLIWLMAAVLVAAVPVFAQDLGNIMPLGDSITAGYLSGVPLNNIPGGYRSPLMQRLVGAGYDFQFVGSHSVYPDGFLLEAGQTYHEGHDGYTIDQIRNGINNLNWLGVNPDIILLHIGANDVTRPQPELAPQRFNSLLDEIYAKSPDVHIVAALIIGGSTSESYDQAVSAYNDVIEQIIQQRISQGDSLSMVDMYSHLSYTNQTDAMGRALFGDISHPNQLGYNLMGEQWFTAIEAIPEPSMVMILAVGGIALLKRRRG